MKEIMYDGGFVSFLCAVKRAGLFGLSEKDKLPPIIAKNPQNPELFNREGPIDGDINCAREVFRSFRVKCGSIAASQLSQAFLREAGGRELVLCRFMVKALKAGPSICEMIGDTDVKAVKDWAFAVAREKHRYMGILRFEEPAKGLLRADFKPRYDIAPLLAPHFSVRIRDDYWLIVDLARDYAICHIPGEAKCLLIKGKEEIDRVCPPNDLNGEYELLWKNYFQAMEIRERKNPRCQANFIPFRDRDFLPEFRER